MYSEKTPMMKQYYLLKEEYRDAILFFRLGDFYEMFADDALIASKELEIVLTARDGGGGQRVPMCGVPFHAADAYVAKLIGKGYKVAICEQVEDAAKTKGLVKRDVVRLVTPGTVLEAQMLPDSSHNYLMAIYQVKDDYGIGYVDISTGDFFATEIKGDLAFERLIDEIIRINPSECILSTTFRNEDVFRLRLDGESIKTISVAENEAFVLRNAEDLLRIHYKVTSLEPFGLSDHNMAVCACALILGFLNRAYKKELEHLKPIKMNVQGQFMFLDARTQKNLEITAAVRTNRKKGSLFGVCDMTKTAMGARRLLDWLQNPLISIDAIKLRLDSVEELYNNSGVLTGLASILKDINDLERLISRISGGQPNPRDLILLKNSLKKLPDIFQYLLKLNSPLAKVYTSHFDILDDVTELISDAIVDEPPISVRDGGVIRQGYHKEIDTLRETSAQGKGILQQIELREKEKTGIKSLKIGFNQVFGYYIEVTNANLPLVPEYYIRKQTLVNAERFITEELKEKENKILSSNERLILIEQDVFNGIQKKVTASRVRIQLIADIIADIDALHSFARIAFDNNYCRPEVNEGSVISISDGRHPVVESIIGTENYVPNDTYLDHDTQQLLLITGPNMTGKSTYMRQVALIVLMAQAGSFVPAKKAVIGKTDRIFTRIGASDDLAAGQSTFMVEMCETANILRHATRDSLVILDEIGRGTSTFDGISIAWAVSEYLMSDYSGAKTLFASHYHELTQLADYFSRIKNYSIAVKEKNGEIVFLRKIIPGGADRSYGIQVAALAGLPKSIIQRAEEILEHMEQEKHNQINIDFNLLNKDSIVADNASIESYNLPIKNFVKEVCALNVNAMTPLEAMLKLNDLCQNAQRLTMACGTDNYLKGINDAK